jgi:hypothetical protein
MSSLPPDSNGDDQPRTDDTAAFSRFYLGQPDPREQEKEKEPDKGLLYRIFLGWWRDR